MKHSQFGSCAVGVVLAGAALAQPAPKVTATALWKQHCASCHAEDASGGSAKTLLDAVHLHGGERGGDRFLFEAVRNGPQGVKDHAFAGTIDDAGVWALVVRLREMQAQSERRRIGKPRPNEAGVYTSRHHSFRVEDVVPKGLSIPWAVDFIPVAPSGSAPAWVMDGSLIITERGGGVRLFKDGELSSPIEGIPETVHIGQGGMMDVQLHPEYATNGWVYLGFNKATPVEGSAGGRRGPTMTSIVRGRVVPGSDAGTFRWTDEQTIFECKPEHGVSSGLHFGTRIVFQFDAAAKRHYVYWAIGDRGDNMMAGERQAAQNLGRPNGKVHRLWDDGSVPDSNPFVGVDGAYPSVWSFGHRNPQGLVFDLTGDLWDTEHGPRGGDELNRIERGANYGWPLVCYGINYSDMPFIVPWAEVAGVGESTTKITMPADRWLPSIGACGLDVVRGKAFPKWEGDLVAGGLSGANVDRFRVKDGAVVEREELILPGRVRDVVTGPEGHVYIVLNGPDKVIRLTPAN